MGVWNCGKTSYLAPEIQAIQPPIQQLAPALLGLGADAPGGLGEAVIYPYPADVWSLACCLWVVAFFAHPYSLAAREREDFRTLVQGQFPAAAAHYPEGLSQLFRDVFTHVDSPEQRPTALQLVRENFIGAAAAP